MNIMKNSNGMKSFSIHQIRVGLSFLVVAVLFVATYVSDQPFLKAPNVGATSDGNVTGWAWANTPQSAGTPTTGTDQGLGWISFSNTTDLSTIAYGVKVDSTTGDFSGHAWMGNSVSSEGDTGWISFNRSETGNPPSEPFVSGTSIAKYDKNTGEVTGWARALVACKDNYWNGTACTNDGAGDKSGGWDGWIKLSDDTNANWVGLGVKIAADGTFSGKAWGDSVLGWIDFAPTIAGIPVGVEICFVCRGNKRTSDSG